MYKNYTKDLDVAMKLHVSILVLMDLCIKNLILPENSLYSTLFQSCFNGSMYKNNRSGRYYREQRKVSILVLMDSCIKNRA